MKKFLIISGDSFTDKNYRSSSHPEMDTSWPKWPEILAKKLDMNLINLGRSGSGNEYIYSSLQDTIERFEDKSKIGLVIAGWSQCFRTDFEKGLEWANTDISRADRGIQGWNDLRINPHGDILGWVKRSLRIYKSFEYMCENHNIPYLQTQMIPMYIDWLRGLVMSGEEARAKGFTPMETWDTRMEYPGDSEADEMKILKTILEYDSIINHDNFIGWPISRKLNGYCLSVETCGLAPESPYVISEYDGHPNKMGQERIAEHVYDWLG
jgi:hypothetical protein